MLHFADTMTQFNRIGLFDTPLFDTPHFENRAKAQNKSNARAEMVAQTQGPPAQSCPLCLLVPNQFPKV